MASDAAAQVHVGARLGARDPPAAVRRRGAARRTRRPLHGEHDVVARSRQPSPRNASTSSARTPLVTCAPRRAACAPPNGRRGRRPRTPTFAQPRLDERLRTHGQCSPCDCRARASRSRSHRVPRRRPESRRPRRAGCPHRGAIPRRARRRRGRRMTHPTRGFTPRAGPARPVRAPGAWQHPSPLASPWTSVACNPGSGFPAAPETPTTLMASPTRAASHPDFHRRYRSSTGSTARARPDGHALPARGLSPPVRTCTDPGHVSCSILGQRRNGGRIPVSPGGHRQHCAAAATCASDGRPYASIPEPGRS